MSEAETEHEQKQPQETITARIEQRAAEYDIYRDADESDAELADRAIAILDDMMSELADAQDELRTLYTEAIENDA